MPSWKAPTIGERPVALLGAGVLGEEEFVPYNGFVSKYLQIIGRRIACSWVAGGYNVIIRDPSPEQRSAAIHFIDNNVAEFSKILSTTSVTKKGTYSAVEDLDSAVKDAWFVIEAVPEKLGLKISIFGELARKAPSDCILGTNSSSYKSSLMLDEVDANGRTRVLNVHYTMPPTTRTVELMTSTYTDEAIFPFLVTQHKNVGLLPAVARKESTGFIFNRLWAAIKRETIKILAEGVSDAEEIDTLWAEMFGDKKPGPCALMDAVGLDTVAFIEDNYIQERHLDPTNTVEFLRKNYIAQGKLGAKSGKGGLYPPGYTTKVKGKEECSTENLAAPTIYLLDIGFGENVHADYFNSGRLIVASADGTTWRAILSGLETPDGIDVSLSTGRIFWTQMGVPSENNGSVLSANLDGSDVKEVISKGQVHTPKQLAIDHQNEKLYFCDREGMRVHRANFDGSEHEIIVQTGDFRDSAQKEDELRWCVGVCIDTENGKFYWTQKGPSKSGKGRIFRANINMPPGGSAPNRPDIELLFDKLPEPIDLEIDVAQKMLYWTDRGEYPLGNTLNRAPVSPGIAAGHATSKFEILSRHLHEGIGLRLDHVNKHVYYTDLGGSVYRSDMDGKNKQTLCNVGATFTGIALAHVG
ncbi:uncharacterized protein N7482_003625 [Penicillium canariense]|uniref:3-hydroxyacyl-CoA dehydrogenase n=1 Tax=Penicillium canariense TaxID=189055 RepID=A0A9W9I6S6_9EURO|nr:uncharacterized protein N7482_003625 [Penicillium canariense]KAJ5168031.1 hypothetical protein N7482_003625 [Penicillium canariense]